MSTKIAGATQVLATSAASATSAIITGASRIRVAVTEDAYISIAEAAYASGTITISGLPANNDTVTVNGTAVTFKTSGATGSQVNIAATPLATAQVLAAFLAASADANLDDCTYSCANSNGSGVITVASKAIGTASNSIALAKSGANIALSAATLLGGLGPTVTSADYVMAKVSGVETFSVGASVAIAALRVTTNGVLSVTPVH